MVKTLPSDIWLWKKRKLSVLPPLMDLIVGKHNSLFGHASRLGNDTPAHQALQHQIDISFGWLPDSTWKCLPALFRVTQEASGCIRFVLTTTSHPLIYGDVHQALSVKVILGWRNGPSWLSDDDNDNDNNERMVSALCFLQYFDATYCVTVGHQACQKTCATYATYLQRFSSIRKEGRTPRGTG